MGLMPDDLKREMELQARAEANSTSRRNGLYPPLGATNPGIWYGFMAGAEAMFEAMTRLSDEEPDESSSLEERMMFLAMERNGHKRSADMALALCEEKDAEIARLKEIEWQYKELCK